MRFSIKQKDSLEVFSSLYKFLSEQKCGYITTHKNYVIFTIDSIKDLQLLILYLNKYPLQSNKNIAYHK
jgi:hypothetical protein